MINLKEEINLSKKFNELEYDSKMLYCSFINSILEKDYNKKYNKEKIYFKRKKTIKGLKKMGCFFYYSK